MPRLTAEERAALERQLADDDAAADDFEVSIRSGDNEARVPYSKGKSWLQKNFGIDLDEEPKQDDGDGDDKAKGGKVVQGRGFGKAPYGRRTG